MQNEYQRRADLIPNLVSTVKGYAKQELDVLTRVTEARASANRIQVTGEQLTDPAAVQRFAQAQNAVTLSLHWACRRPIPTSSRTRTSSRSSRSWRTENRITIARRDYNEAVQGYNTRIRTFPNAIGARSLWARNRWCRSRRPRRARRRRRR
ncbi:LemA family protein [Sphingomonas sp. MMS24-JH45]